MPSRFDRVLATQVGINTNGNDGFTTIYTTPINIDSIYDVSTYLIQLDVACTGDSGVQTSIRITTVNDNDVSVSTFLIKKAPIPPGSTLQVLDGQKLVLKGGDKLEVKCETPGYTVDVVMSYVENVNSDIYEN